MKYVNEGDDLKRYKVRELYTLNTLNNILFCVILKLNLVIVCIAKNVVN